MMAKPVKTIINILLIVVLLFVALNVFLFSFGKRIVCSQIEKSFGIETKIKFFSITPPFVVHIHGLDAGELLKADRISLYPNILGLLGGKVLLNKVTAINPSLVLIQSDQGKLNLPVSKQKGNPAKIYLLSLYVKNAKVTFIDRKVKAEGFKTLINNLDIHASKALFPPSSLRINFKSTARFIRPEGDTLGSISFSGWVDFSRKDMDAKLELADLDVTYFSAYYGDFISNKKLLSAKLNATTYFNAKNNDLKTLTKFRLSDLTYSKEEKDPLGVPCLGLSKKALDLFTDANGNLNLEFEFNTRFDKPEMTISELQNIILKSTVKNIASQDPQDLLEKITDNIESFKKFGKELEDIFKNKE